MANGRALLRAVNALPQVKVAAPRSIANGMLATTSGSAGVRVNGVVPDLEYQTSRPRAKIIEGHLFEHLRRNQIMVGKKLAVKMKLRVGSKLVLTRCGSFPTGATANPTLTMMALAFKASDTIIADLNA